MKRCVAYCALWATLVLIPSLPPTLHAQALESYDDVLLIINERSTSSVEIGEYFAERRGIPERHIYRMDTDSSESMDSATFVPLKWELQEWMKSRNLVDSVNYIVTTKGCPLRVRTRQGDDLQGGVIGGTASFEDCLTLINGADSIWILATRTNFPASRYFNSTSHFRRDPLTLPLYLVTRLDAYTVEQVKSYIRRAETPAILGEGVWVLDLDPGRDNPGYRAGNDWLRSAARILGEKGLQVDFDTTNTYLHGRTDVIGYGSWGSNDGNSGGGMAAIPGNTWLDGSIAETVVSTGGRSFTPGTGYGQSLIADWIAEGACGVKGYTDEPYLLAIAHFDIVFDRYTSGFNMAESFYAGSQLMAWRQVVIGDPKMRLARLLVSAATVDLGSGPRYAPLADTTYIRNIASVPVSVIRLRTTGKDSADFSASPIGGLLPAIIAPGDSLGVIITLVPTLFSKEDALLIAEHRRSDTDRTFQFGISLQGMGVRPPVEVPDTLYLNATDISSPALRTLTIKNPAPSDTITISGMGFSGPDKGYFTLTSTPSFPIIIPGGGEWSVDVTYTPTGTERRTAVIGITSNGTPSLRIVRLVGNVGTGLADAQSRTRLAAIKVVPNPLFNSGRLLVTLAVPRATVRLELVDLRGEVIGSLNAGVLMAGEHSIAISTEGLPAGTYFCRATIVSPASAVTLDTRFVVDR